MCKAPEARATSYQAPSTRRLPDRGPAGVSPALGMGTASAVEFGQLSLGDFSGAAFP